MNEQMTPHMKVILTKLLSYSEFDINEFDFNTREWFMKNTWTDDEESEFKEWMIDYLYKNKKAQKEIMDRSNATKKRIEGTVGYFLLNFGWKSEV